MAKKMRVEDTLPEKAVPEHRSQGHTWNDVMWLPSRKLPYGKADIQWRSPTYGEMVELNAKKENEMGHISVLRNLVRGIQLESLTYEDFKAILLKVSLEATPSKTWNMLSLCPYCNHKNSSSLTPPDFDFRETTEESPKGNIKVTLNGKEVVFGYYLLSDHINVKHAPSEYNKDILRDAAYIKNMDLDAAYRFLYHLPVEEGIKAGEEIVKFDHGVNPHIVTCERCEAKYHLIVGLEVTNLLPFRRSL